MASQNDRIECGICLEDYNDTNRRPKVLPCGHNFCGPCLQNFLARGGNKCSICRKEHSASNVDDIPINTDLEKVIQMLTIAQNFSKTNDSLNQEDDFSYGQCAKHKKSWLYFKCKTHDIYICRECAVIEHAPPSCNLIEIEELVECVLEEAEMNIDLFAKATTSLGNIIVKKKDKIARKKIQIESLLKEVEEDSKFCNEAQMFIDENKNFPLQAQKCIKGLQKAKTNKKMKDECSEKLEISEKILVEFEHKYLSEVLLKDINCAAHHIKERGDNFYAVNGEDKGRGSIIHSSCNYLNVGKFKDIVDARQDATYIPISTLLSATYLQPVVWLNLQARGRPLVHLKISLTCGPRRQDQMLRLFTQRDGPGYMGSWFDVAWDVGQAGEGMECYGYNTGESIFSTSRSDSLIVEELEENDCERYVEGAVTGYMDNARFVICTRTQPVKMNNTKYENQTIIKKTRPSWMGPEIGHVVIGLNLLRDALRDHTTQEFGPFYNASKLKIWNVGIEIPYDYR